MKNVTIEELLTYNNANIIDIRSEQSYNNNHIPGAINIPYNKLIINPGQYLNRLEKYFLYCKKGLVSKKLANYLNTQGYNVYSVIGGYEEWILKK